MGSDGRKPAHGSAFVGASGERRSIDVVLHRLGGPASDLRLVVFEDPACLEDPGDDLEDDLHSIDAPARKATRPRPGVDSRSGSPSRSVLVIDDHVDHAEGIRLLLELRGCPVAVAHDVAAGIEKACHFRPSVVLCSAALDGALGEGSLARALRAEPALASTCLVALLPAENERLVAEVRKAGYDDHLAKPVDPASLIQLIERMPRPI
jgi:CheY-like chemotaxis protein